MQFLALALVTATCYGGYYFFIGAASQGIHRILGAVILQVVAALMGVALLVFLKCTGVQFTATKGGFAFACAAGIAVGLAEITSFVLYARGAPITFGTPIIVGVSTLVAGILGVLFLKESLHLPHIIGAVLIVAGAIVMTSAK